MFTDLKRYDEALVAYEKALALALDLAEAWLGRGKVFNEPKRHDEALAAFRKAQALKPDLAEAHFSEAFVRLLLGDTERGWEKYEYRWKTREYKKIKRNFSQPLWLGDSPVAKKNDTAPCGARLGRHAHGVPLRADGRRSRRKCYS